MRTLVRREFTVEVPIEAAWEHLARVERWPSWAKHIRRAVLTPPGALTARSEGEFVLGNGVRSRFQMTEFTPPAGWKWRGPFLWLTIDYDHRFEKVGDRRTRLVWTVDAEGPGVAVFGRLFGAIYSRNLDRAIPRLVAEVESAGVANARRAMP